MSSALTPLSFALLGLIRSEARSGYALRRVFETTLLGNYSSSPGSIYPALKGLQAKGLIEQRPSGAKSVFAITPAGLAALEAWLAMPVTAEEMNRNMDAVMLRFALLQDHADRKVTVAFLTSFAAASRDGVAAIRAFQLSDVWQDLPLQSRLAVEFGLRGCETRAQWAADALQALSETQFDEVKSVKRFSDKKRDKTKQSKEG